jgi:hypothetical protein
MPAFRAIDQTSPDPRLLQLRNREFTMTLNPPARGDAEMRAQHSGMLDSSMSGKGAARNRPMVDLIARIFTQIH